MELGKKESSYRSLISQCEVLREANKDKTVLPMNKRALPEDLELETYAERNFRSPKERIKTQCGCGKWFMSKSRFNKRCSRCSTKTRTHWDELVETSIRRKERGK